MPPKKTQTPKQKRKGRGRNQKTPPKSPSQNVAEGSESETEKNKKTGEQEQLDQSEMEGEKRANEEVVDKEVIDLGQDEENRPKRKFGDADHTPRTEKEKKAKQGETEESEESDSEVSTGETPEKAATSDDQTTLTRLEGLIAMLVTSNSELVTSNKDLVEQISANHNEGKENHGALLVEIKKNKAAIDEQAKRQAQKQTEDDERFVALTDRVTALEISKNSDEAKMSALITENLKLSSTVEKLGTNQDSLAETAVLHEKMKRLSAFARTERQGMMMGLDMKEWPKDECRQRQKIIEALTRATELPEEQLKSVIISHQVLGPVKPAPKRSDGTVLPDSAPIRLEFRSQYTRSDIGKSLKKPNQIRIATSFPETSRDEAMRLRKEGTRIYADEHVYTRLIVQNDKKWGKILQLQKRPQGSDTTVWELHESEHVKVKDMVRL